MTPSGKACSVCHLSSFQWPAFYGTFTLLFCKRGIELDALEHDFLELTEAHENEKQVNVGEIQELENLKSDYRDCKTRTTLVP